MEFYELGSREKLYEPLPHPHTFKTALLIGTLCATLAGAALLAQGAAIVRPSPLEQVLETIEE